MQYGRDLAPSRGKQSTDLSTGSVDKETQSRTQGGLLPCRRQSSPSDNASDA